MKVIRSTEWEPIYWCEQYPGMEGPVYIFLNKRYNDTVALKVVKYVNVPENDVFIYNASNRTISLSCDKTVMKETSLPSCNVTIIQGKLS